MSDSNRDMDLFHLYGNNLASQHVSIAKTKTKANLTYKETERQTETGAQRDPEGQEAQRDTERMCKCNNLEFKKI